MTAPPLPPMLLLAGSSEAGKSTAGQHLAHCGAVRLKIRTVLLELTSGVEEIHEGVATRIGFDFDEFLTRLAGRVVDSPLPPLVAVESFIDAALATHVRDAWPSVCRVVFVDAPRQLRVSRLARASGSSVASAERIVAAKDARKRVVEQLPIWHRIADAWIVNDTTITQLETALEDVMASTLRSAASPGSKR